MSLEHTNRKGDTYILQSGKTRTGKARYWCGRKLTGEPVDAIPKGYELREDPANALVTLRKVRPTEISLLEKELLAEGIRKHAGLEHFIVDVDGDSLVVYLPGIGEDDADRMLNMFSVRLPGTSPRMRAAKASMIRDSNYTKMLRFTLMNPAERTFVVHRWCFKGSIDDWIWLGGPAALPDLVRQYAQHLGKESFFELM